MSVVEQKQERIRAALRELESPTSVPDTCEAIVALYDIWISDSFEEIDGPLDVFVGDDDFKEEIFSARVIQILITVAQDKEEYPPSFYNCACSVLSFLCRKNTELATTFVANCGVEFLLETLEAFSSDQFVLISCLEVHQAVIKSLDNNEWTSFASMTLEKLLDVGELNFQTADGCFYANYCNTVFNCFRPGLDLDKAKKCYPRTVDFVWHGITNHNYNEYAKGIGRIVLRGLVGEEKANEMIEHAEMHH
jgi:hypothetical protein